METGRIRRAVDMRLLSGAEGVGGLLRGGGSDGIIFGSVYTMLARVLSSGILMIDGGKGVLKIDGDGGIERVDRLVARSMKSRVSGVLGRELLDILSAGRGIGLRALNFSSSTIRKYRTVVAPVSVTKRHLKALFVCGRSTACSVSSVVLDRCNATMMKLRVLHSIGRRDTRRAEGRRIIRTTVDALSFSRLRTVVRVFGRLSNARKVLITDGITSHIKVAESIVIGTLHGFRDTKIVRSHSSKVGKACVGILGSCMFARLREVRGRQVWTRKRSGVCRKGPISLRVRGIVSTSTVFSSAAETYGISRCSARRSCVCLRIVRGPLAAVLLSTGCEYCVSAKARLLYYSNIIGRECRSRSEGLLGFGVRGKFCRVGREES